MVKHKTRNIHFVEQLAKSTRLLLKFSHFVIFPKKNNYPNFLKKLRPEDSIRPFCGCK